MTKFQFIKTSLAFLVAFVLIRGLASAQEHVYPLGVNHVILEYLEKDPGLVSRRTAIFDTVQLPFVDDFSRPGIYPFDSLWEDKDVFINSNYANRPVTIGVATFDGLDAFGRPHDSLSSSDAIADYLTSRPIDLGGLQNDPTVWLSFFVQPQGLGDIPEPQDSLVLQFKDSSGNWNWMWSEAGRADSAFKRVNIHINDNKYLYKGFQFRFYNIATVNGNRDHWNLDYVILNKNTAANDSIRDNAFINVQGSLLNEFSAMPYPHYKSLSNPASAVRTSFSDTIRNINYGNTSLNYILEIQDEQQIVQYSSIPSNLNSSSGTNTIFNTTTTYSFSNSLPKDSTHFLFKSYFSQPGILSNANNDTSYHTQYFHNYYAYDDGSAEIAYGITGNADVKLAYLFNVKMTDTLRGVQIYFNPTGLNVHNKLFQLAVWSQLTVGSSNDNLIYKMIDQKPANPDSINGFATYYFDSLLVIPAGNIYVGIIQNEPQTLYGIGLDRNTDSRSKMFYHVDGFWYQTSVKGSWMIRPFFGKESPVVSVNEINPETFEVTLYPNPANSQFNIEIPGRTHDDYQVTMFNITGQKLLEEKFNPQHIYNTKFLSPSIYFVRITDNRKGTVSVRKLIIRN
ncbi:MAG: T9SS C-terminal target domain-containing protein [Bacteroidetes bacterium]|nr:MAG: T9SS C-terminal target domain-containing protein [Bacteroidota bacterium]REK33673.1 MAG: T9SS C-terminal target domain-containing protein [Bacteroidota bacterium]